MKIVQFDSFGKPDEVTRCVDVGDVGAPAADEAVIDVLAFPINPADLLTIEGRYAVRPTLPARVGAECIGRVIALGRNVRDLAEGDFVIPLDRENWVQRKKVKAALLVKVPSGVDPQQLAMLKVNPPTAHLMMTQYVDLKRGDWLVQDAANSGVGHCVIQLARAAGVRTVNVVRRDGLADQLLALGGDIVLVDAPDLGDRVRAATHGASIRLAIDAVAGTQVVRLGDCLADEGIVVNYGLLSGENPQLTAHQTVFKRLWLTGFWLVPALQGMTPNEIRDLYGMLAGRIADGALRVPVEATYPIEEIGKAVARANAYRRAGKVLVTPNGPLR
jgi:NADPH:quinone reductase-like Zn-dependent oxidoreductase